MSSGKIIGGITMVDKATQSALDETQGCMCSGLINSDGVPGCGKCMSEAIEIAEQNARKMESELPF